jgi:hypothetical protein
VSRDGCGRTQTWDGRGSSPGAIVGFVEMAAACSRGDPTTCPHCVSSTIDEQPRKDRPRLPHLPLLNLPALLQRAHRHPVAVVGRRPARVTTDGHDSYPRALRATLGTKVMHRHSRYLNNRLEQDHRGIKQRYSPMQGFGNEPPSCCQPRRRA